MCFSFKLKWLWIQKKGPHRFGYGPVKEDRTSAEHSPIVMSHNWAMGNIYLLDGSPRIA